jgi:signal transduction histidine kinase
MAIQDTSPEMILARTRFAAIAVLLPLAIAFIWTGEPAWRWGLPVLMICLLAGISLTPAIPQRLSVNGVVIAPAVLSLWTGGIASFMAAILVVTTASSALVVGPSRGMFIRTGIASAALIAGGLLAGVPGFIPVVFDRTTPVGMVCSPLLWTWSLMVFLWVFAIVMAQTRAHLEETKAAAVSLEVDLAESLRARNRELTAISGSLAHELKNPLASIQGLATHLARKAEGPHAEQLGVMVGEIHRMGDILNGLLDVSRPLGSLSLVDADLTQLAQEVVQLHTSYAAQRGVALRTTGEGVARVDPRKVRQVLLNLLLNAIEAQATVVELHVEQVGSGAVIEVRDNGQGFEGDPQRLLASGVTTKNTGNGLGLAICVAIAEQHGGTLRLASNDPGCIAILTLPGGAA